jgi:hypothetical protein
MNIPLVLRRTLLAMVILVLTACHGLRGGYAPVKLQGTVQAVVDPMGTPMPKFNGLRYRWGLGADRYQIVVDLNSRQMAWSRRAYQSTAPDSDELTGVKYKKLSAEGANKIIQAANKLWASETPLERKMTTNMPGDLTLYAEGTVLESCCGAGESVLGDALRSVVLEIFSQK